MLNDSSRTFSFDKFGFAVNPKTGTVKNLYFYEVITGLEKGITIVFFEISADGQFVQIYIIIFFKNIDSFLLLSRYIIKKLCYSLLL